MTHQTSTRLPLHIRWNADMSLTVYCQRKKVTKYSSLFARASVDDFCEGWFGTADKAQWKVSWSYKYSKKEVAA